MRAGCKEASKEDASGKGGKEEIKCDASSEDAGSAVRVNRSTTGL